MEHHFVDSRKEPCADDRKKHELGLRNASGQFVATIEFAPTSLESGTIEIDLSDIVLRSPTGAKLKLPMAIKDCRLMVDARFEKNCWNRTTRTIYLVALESITNLAVLFHELGHMAQGRDDAFRSMDIASAYSRHHLFVRGLNLNSATWPGVFQAITAVMDYPHQVMTSSDRIALSSLLERCLSLDEMRTRAQKQLDRWFLSSPLHRAAEDTAEQWGDTVSSCSGQLDTYLKECETLIVRTLRGAILLSEIDASKRAHEWAQRLSDEGVDLLTATEFRSHLDWCLDSYAIDE